MSSRITAIAAAGVAAIAVAGVATASTGHSAKTYRASVAAVNPAATTAGVANVSGKAQMVDGKANNKASLHVRDLTPNTTYLWHVHEGSCAATGAPVAGWTYRTSAGANGTLTTGASGNANTKATSKTFNADPAKSYSVNVHVAAATNGLPAGTIIACGDLVAKVKKPHPVHPVHPAHAKGPKS